MTFKPLNFSVLEDNIKKYSNLFLENYSFNELKVELITNDQTIKEYKDLLKSDSLFNQNIDTLIKDIDTLKYLYKFTINCKTNTFHIHLLTYFNIEKSNYKEIKEIYLVTNIMSSLFLNNTNTNETDIYFYLYNKPRNLNVGNNTKTLSTLNKLNNFNCPSGYTLSNKSKIVITRFNHYVSLYIHELLHYYEIDQQDNIISINWDNIFPDCFNNYKHGYFFEAIDNVKSCVINLLIKKYIGNNDSLNNYDSQILYKLEYKYSLFLCLSLMKFLNCKSFKEMIKKDNKFNGSTFEYSFCKLILMLNPHLFKNDNQLTFDCDINKMKKILKNFNLVFDKKEYDKLNRIFNSNSKDKNIIDYYFI